MWVDAATQQQGLSFHSFLARLFRDGLLTHINCCVWVVRDALEHRPSEDPEADAFDVAVAAEWILRASEALKAALVDGEVGDKQWLMGRELYDGPWDFHTERWAFWKRRFAELAETIENPSWKEKASQAAQLM